MSILQVKKSKVTETAKEVSLTGGAKFMAESGAQKAKIAACYITTSTKGALIGNIHLNTEDGTNLKMYKYMTDKEQSITSTHDGKTTYRAGYTWFNNMCLLATGNPLFDEDLELMQDIEEKFIDLYNFDQKAMVPTKVNMLMDTLCPKDEEFNIVAGIIKQTVDKNVKNEAFDPSQSYSDTNQAWIPSGEVKDENQIEVWFHIDDNRTVIEVQNGVEDADYFPQWEDKNKGKTRFLAKAAKKGATPTQGTDTAPKKKLFGNKG